MSEDVVLDDDVKTKSVDVKIERKKPKSVAPPKRTPLKKTTVSSRLGSVHVIFHCFVDRDASESFARCPDDRD